jgi:hypothetical protein
LACDVIERTQHPHLLGLSWRWHPQVGAGIRSRPREIGMRQRLTPVVVRQNDVTGFGVAFTQVQTKADPIHLAGCLPSLQDVPGLPPTELFFATPWKTATGRCEYPRTPGFPLADGQSSSSAGRPRALRAMVLLHNAIALFTGSSRDATLAFSA